MELGEIVVQVSHLRFQGLIRRAGTQPLITPLLVKKDISIALSLLILPAVLPLLAHLTKEPTIN